MKYELHIKNMVCDRCIRIVKEELEKAGYTISDIKLGEAVLEASTDPDWNRLADILSENGFELLRDARARLADSIKTHIIELIHYGEPEKMTQNYSAWLTDKLGKDYNYLSQLFSSLQGMTIERYIILQKIEKAKELMIYEELNLTEIAYRLGYSSVAHFSNQFRQVTGMSPSAFRKLSDKGRKPLDKV